MTSFITTMFVHILSPSQFSTHYTLFPSCPSAPKPLPPVFTLPPPAPAPCIRTDPRACVFGGQDNEVPVRRDAGCWDDAYWHRAHLGYTPPAIPGGVYTSPLQKAFREALRNNLQALLAANPTAATNMPLDQIPESSAAPGFRSQIPALPRDGPRTPPRRGILKYPNQGSPDRPQKRLRDNLGRSNANAHLLGSSNNRVGRTNNGGTAAFRPKEGKRGTSSWQLKQFAEATLGSGSLRKAVQLPEGEDLGEWMAVNGTHIRGTDG